MLSAKTHEASLVKGERRKKKIKAKICRLEEIYDDYCVEVGIQNCCHIPRESGSDFSLMTEIVFDKGQSSLFPEEEEDDTATMAKQKSKSRLSI